MRPDLAGLTPEAAYIRGRNDRIGNWMWRMTIIMLGIVGFNTLVSGFAIFLLACMGIDPNTVEMPWRR